MKKQMVLFLFVTMLLMVYGCQNEKSIDDMPKTEEAVPNENIKPTTEAPVTEEPASQESVSGFFIGSIYENPWLELKISFDESYYIATEDDIGMMYQSGLLIDESEKDLDDNLKDNEEVEDEMGMFTVLFAVFEKPFSSTIGTNGNYMATLTKLVDANVDISGTINDYLESYTSLFGERLLEYDLGNEMIGVNEYDTLMVELDNGFGTTVIKHYLRDQEGYRLEITETMDGNNPLPSISVLFE